MSFIITIATNEGVVMASDSRMTCGNFTNDTTYKTFMCNSRAGISACGHSSFPNGSLAYHIENMIATRITEHDSVDDITKTVQRYFQNLDPKAETTFLISGYNTDNSFCQVRRYINFSNTLDEVLGYPGAVWSGEKDIMEKLLTHVYSKGTNPQGQTIYSPVLKYKIHFEYFTLQDAIDFAKYAVDVTIKSIAFEDRPNSVGGPIDILAIKPNAPAFWVAHKEIHA